MGRPSEVYAALAARLGVPRAALAALDAEIMAYDGCARADNPEFYVDRLVCTGCASPRRLRAAARDACAAARAGVLGAQPDAVPAFAALQTHLLAAVERAGAPDAPRAQRAARFNRALVELWRNYLDGCAAKIVQNITALAQHEALLARALERDRETLRALLLERPPRDVRDRAVAAVGELKRALAVARYQLAILDDGFAQTLGQIAYVSEHFPATWDGDAARCSSCRGGAEGGGAAAGVAGRGAAPPRDVRSCI